MVVTPPDGLPLDDWINRAVVLVREKRGLDRKAFYGTTNPHNPSRWESGKRLLTLDNANRILAPHGARLVLTLEVDEHRP